MCGSFLSFIIDIVLFYILKKIFEFSGFTLNVGHVISTGVATVGARAVSSVFNFTFNKKMVFSCKNDLLKTFLKYYALCIPQMLVSWGLVSLIEKFVAPNAGAFLVTVIKLVVDTVLFVVSYQIQKHWVFKKEHKDKNSK